MNKGKRGSEPKERTVGKKSLTSRVIGPGWREEGKKCGKHRSFRGPQVRKKRKKPGNEGRELKPAKTDSGKVDRSQQTEQHNVKFLKGKRGV